MTTKLKSALAVIGMAIIGTSHVNPADAKELTYQNLVLVEIKLSGDSNYSAMADDYLKIFMNNAWEKAHKNEFSDNSQKKDAQKRLPQIISSLNIKEPFNISTTADFGEYDFKSGKFNFNPITSSTSFSVQADTSYLPSKISLYFDNPELINGIPFAKADAEKFASQGVYRSVALEIQAVPVSIYNINDVLAHIVSYKIRSDMPTDSKLLYQSPGPGGDAK